MTSPGQLTLHADRGGPMKAKPTALLLADLGLTRSHNRPYTSTTTHSRKSLQDLKYQPRLPQRCGCIEDAKSFHRHFLDLYNQEHHHVAIGLMTPARCITDRPTPCMPFVSTHSIVRSAKTRRASSTKPQRHPPNPADPPEAQAAGQGAEQRLISCYI